MPYASLKEVFPGSSFISSNSYGGSFMKTSNERFSNSEHTSRHAHIVTQAPKFHNNPSVQSPVEGIYKDYNYAPFNDSINSFGSTKNSAFEMNATMQRALEYDTCNSFLYHFKDCTSCRIKALRILNDINTNNNNNTNNNINGNSYSNGNMNESEWDIINMNDIMNSNGNDNRNGNRNGNTNGNRNGNGYGMYMKGRIEEFIEFLLFIGSGIFLLYIMG